MRSAGPGALARCRDRVVLLDDGDTLPVDERKVDPRGPRRRPPARLSRRLQLALVLVASVAMTAGSSVAEAAPPPTDEVGGVVRPASPPGDGARTALDALLFLPRTIVQIVVIASTATASFFEDQQVVPRTQALLGSEDGTVRVTPTLSLASGLRPDVGARMTARAGSFASMLRMSIVGPNHYVAEARLLQALGKTGHTQLVLEGYQQRRSGLGFGGVGEDPRNDPRNAFLPGRQGTEGVFLESRQRLIAGVASRVANDYELLLSSSFQRRRIEDSPDDGAGSLANTFVPGTVPGAYDRSERTYTEVAIRRDTRAVRGPPAAGLLVEGYAGASQDVHGTYAPAVHAGGRVAWFVSVVRKTTIISPRFTLDVVGPIGEKSLPFREYAYASGFRGSDGRVDHVAALASLDYRWQLRQYVAARLFVDVTTVANEVTSLDVKHLAWATGFGLDLHSSATQIGRVGFSYSPDAFQLVLVFGLADPGFGDRQHR